MPESDLELLIARVREAGAIARKYFKAKYKVWSKGGGDPVTQADIEIDEFLKATLIAARPDYGWLSEESENDPTRLTKARTFIVDPIDGTYGFVKHRPQFTIVAAVVEQGRPISAAVYNPITEEMYDAGLGEGARKNGTPIRVSGRATIEGARFLATRHFLKPADWAVPWPDGISVETRASIAYRMALVAEGAFDAMISLTEKSDWDLAAADLIVHEAGGLVTTAEGAPFHYNREAPRQGSVICAPPVLDALLIERLREHLPGPH